MLKNDFIHSFTLGSKIYIKFYVLVKTIPIIYLKFEHTFID